MGTNNFCPDGCPLDCDDILAVVPDFGCEQPNDEDISRIYWGNSALETGLLTEMSARVSNSSTSGTDMIRFLDVQGNLPRVDPVIKRSKLGTAAVQEADREITFTFEDDSDNSFALMSGFQCGMTKKFWFKSGKHFYGGLSGIDGTLYTSYEINKGGDLMAHNWAAKIVFKSKCFPSRVAAVI